MFIVGVMFDRVLLPISALPEFRHMICGPHHTCQFYEKLARVRGGVHIYMFIFLWIFAVNVVREVLVINPCGLALFLCCRQYRNAVTTLVVIVVCQL